MYVSERESTIWRAPQNNYISIKIKPVDRIGLSIGACSLHFTVRCLGKIHVPVDWGPIQTGCQLLFSLCSICKKLTWIILKMSTLQQNLSLNFQIWFVKVFFLHKLERVFANWISSHISYSIFLYSIQQWRSPLQCGHNFHEMPKSLETFPPSMFSCLTL